ncbi:RNA polymerase sigma factor [Actinomadura chibensis]|uniref:RNA polymerase sigma factor n=1 Tax=Actinomadura chibensis TaxID=392828 RepID=A0A5D0NNE5_9ACTN|nr:RNA polymerase sigma factor [Actinomadura chibensis]
MLRRVGGGDEQALRVLFERHAPWLRVRLARRCGDADAVADVLQDTFVAVWRGAGRFRGEGEVAAWLWGIAVRRLVSRLRRADAAARPSARTDGGVLASAEEQVLLGVEYGDAGGALRRLSPELRAVVQATVLDGLSTREAARLLGMPASTVKFRLRKATAQLREDLLALPTEGMS